MKNPIRWATALVALAVLPACSEPSDPASRVVSYRVLAQQMDLPYAAPGETVHVSSLSFDPAGRSVTWAWATCLNPTTTAVEGCIAKLAADSNGSLPLIAMGTDVDAVDVDVPTDALSSLPVAVRSTASMGVLSVACPGVIAEGTGPAGLPFQCKDATSGRELELDEFVLGVKRIVVREHDRNQNPEIARVLFDGTEWSADEVREVHHCDTDANDLSVCPEQLQHRVSATLTPESLESGTNEFGEAFEEQLVVQYFATEGIFESDFRTAESPENKWAARTQSAGKDITFWFVARDNRGGVSWTSRQAHAD
jgi:hypothetical protein